MLKYGTTTINKTLYNQDTINKIYSGGTLVNGYIPTQYNIPGFGYVQKLSKLKYQTYPRVYVVSEGKWYMRNTSGEYEPYGVYETVSATTEATAYEGKLIIVDDNEYQYTSGTWVNVGEITGSTISLPDISYVCNYNAQNYDPATNTILRSDSEQTLDEDVALTGGTPVDNGTYITISTEGISGDIAFSSTANNPFNRTSSSPEMTLIYKANWTSQLGYSNILANRSNNYNWMARGNMFHTIQSGFLGFEPSVNPNTIVVRCDSNRLAERKCIETDQIATGTCSYGSESTGVSFFNGYYRSGSEYFTGDFYYLYFTQSYLTDAQIQQVIDYNENTSIPEIPVEYATMPAPGQDITFATLADLEAYNNYFVGFYGSVGDSGFTFTKDFVYELEPSQ